MNTNTESTQHQKLSFALLHNKFVSSKIAVIVTLLIIFTWPLGLYGLWKGKHFNVTVRWIVTGLMIVRALYNLTVVTPQNTNADYKYESCAATITEGNCTYYRDDNCEVVARLCE